MVIAAFRRGLSIHVTLTLSLVRGMKSGSANEAATRTTSINNGLYLNKQYTIMSVAIVACFLVYFEVLWRVIW
jgi:hypothetical protein